MVPLGLWDVLTGLRDCDGKLGHHSTKSVEKVCMVTVHVTSEKCQLVITSYRDATKTRQTLGEQ